MRTITSCISNADAHGPALCQQVLGQQGRLVSLSFPDANDQSMRARVAELVEPTLQSCRCGLSKDDASDLGPAVV